MRPVWQDWTTDDSADPAGVAFRSPYGDWYLETDPGSDAERSFTSVSQRGSAGGNPAFPFALPDLPLPKTALPPGATAITAPVPRPNVLDGLEIRPGKQDVIIGVIDAGIALSHERFRRRGAVGTRILSHWTQGGTWQGQPHLPFGRELMQRDIDGLMGPLAEVDEARFNRAAKLADFAVANGERWIETSDPHGTHVADLAAGCDPLDPAMAGLRDRTHLIAVDLAPRVSIGASGSFLESYAIWAIRHIVATADAIWQALYPDDPQRGFALVINMSYGLHAGPKDGSMAIQKFVRSLDAGRDPLAPVRLVLPAGNDNLDRASAVLAGRLQGATDALDWRILPEDRTSGYAEIWTEAEALSASDAGPAPISVLPPQGRTGPGTCGRAGQRSDLVDQDSGQVLARIYCRKVDNLTGVAELDTQPKQSVGYVICVAPSWRPEGGAAPSGAWTITLGEGKAAQLYVQSDQVLVPGTGGALLSYFEDVVATPAALRYRSHNPDGSLRDTYAIDRRNGAVSDNEPAGQTGPIRRQNTVSAIAGAVGALTIAGYRASDGWPAGYSATGLAVPGSDGGRITAALISDDSPWRFGRLAAGGRSGAVVALQGTSFATGEATRLLAQHLLDWRAGGSKGPAPGSAAEIETLAAAADAAAVAAAGGAAVAAAGGAANLVPAAKLALKLGAGRLPRQDHGRLAR